MKNKPNAGFTTVSTNSLLWCGLKGRWCYYATLNGYCSFTVCRYIGQEAGEQE